MVLILGGLWLGVELLRILRLTLHLGLGEVWRSGGVTIPFFNQERRYQSLDRKFQKASTLSAWR